MITSRQPLSLFYNQKSGFHSAYREQIYECILSLFHDYGFEIQLFDLAQVDDLDVLMHSVIQQHLRSEQRGIIVVAGGDGTLNSVVARLLEYDIPLGILPFGTFNYVARALHIPLDLLEAAEVIVTGRDQAINVATLNDHIYLNNASLGLYPLFVQRREQFNRYLGRFSWHAYSSALEVLLRCRQELQLSLEINGQQYPLTTPLIFFGNNQLQLQEMKLQVAECAAIGRIAGVAVSKGDKWTLLKIVWQMVQGSLEQVPEIYSFCGDQVVVNCKQHKLTVALDGEIVEMKPPLKFGIYRQALKIRVPE